MELRRVAGWIFVVLGGSGILVSLALTLTYGRGAGLVLGLVALPFVAALPLALLVVGWRLAHPGAVSHEPPRPRDVTPVPVVSETDAASLPMPVTACPDCGYLDIRMPTIHDGLWPGGGETGGRFVCPRCDWQGLPVSFASSEAYAAFVRDLNAPREEASV